MSDIKIYENQAAIDALTPISGDLVVNRGTSTLHLCTGTSPVSWKIFTPDENESFENAYSLSFDGSSDYLTVPESSDVNLSGDVTLSAWVKRVNSSGYSAIFTKRQVGGSMNYQFIINNSTKRIGLGHSGGAWVYNTSTTIESGAWYHVAVTVSGSTAQFYINGVAGDSFTGASISATTHDLHIGATVGYNYFNGSIDEASLFNTALSASAVASLIDTSGENPVPANISYLNPVAWYRMGDDSNDSFVDGGSVASITDSSGNGNNATQATASAQPTFSTDVPA